MKIEELSASIASLAAKLEKGKESISFSPDTVSLPDDKVNTFMDLFHGRLEDIASRTLMNGGGRGQSAQNTINLYDLN